jgi:hypothetical protein
VEEMETYDYQYTDSTDPSYAGQEYPVDAALPKPTWLKWLVRIGLVVIFLGILAGVRREHMAGTCLAFLNCLIGAIAIVRFANKRSLCCIIPIAFLTWLILGWGVGTIYFAIFLPDGAYGQASYLYQSIRLQTVILVFLIPYLAASFYMLRNEQPHAPLEARSAHRLNFWVLAFFSVVVSVFIIIKTFSLPGDSTAGTFLNYSASLPLLLGAQITLIRLKGKIFTIALFCLMLFFFALANVRRYAMVPILSFLMGFFLLSQVSTKVKLTILLIVLASFPAYVVIGNTVRTIIGTGGYEDLGYRLQVMKEWKGVAKRTPWTESVFGRLFFVGGHSVITRTPSERPYLGFDPSQYIKETAVSFIPGKVLPHMPIYLRARYMGNFILNNYGFHLTEEHQVGVTLLGHFWLLGGYPFIIIGAFAVAFLQWIFISIVNRALRRAPEKALFYLAFILTVMIWMPGRGFISAMRQLFWYLVLGTAFFYLFINPFLQKTTYDSDDRNIQFLDEATAV